MARRLGDLHVLEDGAHDLFDGLALGLGLVREDDAVAQDVGRDGLDVLGC